MSSCATTCKPIETCKTLGTADLSAALPGMTMPTAAVVGEQGYATPFAMAEAMHRTIKDSTLTIFADTRHITPLEAPDRIGDEFSTPMERARER